MHSKDTSSLNEGSLKVSSGVSIDPLRNLVAFKNNLSSKLKEESKESIV